MNPFEDFLDQIQILYPDVKIFAHEGKNNIKITSLLVPKEQRRKGIGTDIIKKIKEYAQKVNKTISLSPAPEKGYKAKLTKFYKDLGFVQNKGRNKDFELSDPFAPTMYWKPETFKEWIAKHNTKNKTQSTRKTQQRCPTS
jgi:GNAT superfamily N-acetyltransferase